MGTVRWVAVVATAIAVGALAPAAGAQAQPPSGVMECEAAGPIQIGGAFDGGPFRFEISATGRCLLRKTDGSTAPRDVTLTSWYSETNEPCLYRHDPEISWWPEMNLNMVVTFTDPETGTAITENQRWMGSSQARDTLRVPAPIGPIYPPHSTSMVGGSSSLVSWFEIDSEEQIPVTYDRVPVGIATAEWADHLCQWRNSIVFRWSQTA